MDAAAPEQTLCESAFLLREPFGVAFRRTGPRTGFPQSEHHPEEGQREDSP